jgi:endonuclease/exonuclease/phosphatase family metal-dependent hydrolase
VEGARVRFVSWNVHGTVGTDGRRDPERVARVLEALAPDVVGLQEVGGRLRPGDPPDPAVGLGRLLGLQAAFGPTLDPSVGCYGNAVLSRFAIEATRTYDLSVPGREPRGCLRADLVGPAGVRVHFFTVHLGLHWRERRRQAAQLLSADILRDAALAFPLVLVGDFNVPSRLSAVPRWLRKQLTDCAVAAGDASPTFPSRFPLLRLDRAFVDAALRVERCEVLSSPLARKASDHLPLVVDVELAAAARPAPPVRPVEVAGVETTFRRDG